ncbi:MAG: cysteine desulfurase [Cytophagales bacterium]|nr:MAG: cysteine desulfurase [Cytophagales bacterium]
MKTIGDFTIESIRNDFPILNQKINGKNLVYFDNAATTQKPTAVINSISDYYNNYNANIHRGIHTLAEKATAEYELTRTCIKDFLNAESNEQIIFTRGVTESINLVARSYGATFLKPNDEVIISTMEHHSNIVPWQMICEEKGAILRIIPINDKGEIIMSEFQNLLSNKTKIVSIVHVSNALGTINPIEEIIEKAHKVGAVVLIDGAQSVSHLEIDVQALDADFFVFSGHKLFCPTGIGVLYGKKEILEKMPPYQGGGEMIKDVSFEKTTYNELPYKFEAGTPNIADTIALRKGIEYLLRIGRKNTAAYENELLLYCTQKLSEYKEITFIGTAEKKVSVCSFIMQGIHPQDIGMILDSEGIAIRTGHHCTQPLMQRFNIPGTARASFAFYNTFEEIDKLYEGIKKVIRMTS